MILVAKNAFTLQWTITDSAGNPINNANVSATMYQGRSAINPNGQPGIIVPPINASVLVYVPASAGVYQAAEPATLNPTPNADGTYPPFTLVVDAVVSGNPVYHTEEPIQVVAAVQANAADLTTLEAVKAELTITNNNSDSELQQYITAWSLAVLDETGIKSFSQPVQMNEVRDGNGNTQMFTRMRPIINVASVSINGVAVQSAGAWPSSGYYVADDQKSIKLRNVNLAPGRGTYPTYSRQQPAFGFVYGQGNVALSYWAGFANVPADLEMASRRMIAVYYGRKQTRDIASKGLASGGTTATTRYKDWAAPPEVCKVVEFYKRLAVIG